MTINYTSAGSNIQDATYDFIGAKELGKNGWDLYPHNVGDGQLTISAGINLTSGRETNRYAVYRALGIKVGMDRQKVPESNCFQQRELRGEKCRADRA